MRREPLEQKPSWVNASAEIAGWESPSCASASPSSGGAKGSCLPTAISKSLRTQRLNDIHTCGARRRHRRSNHSRRKQHKCRHDYRQCARHADIRDVPAGQAGKDVTQRGAGNDTRPSHYGALGDNTSQAPRWLRSDGQTAPKLACAGAGGKCGQLVASGLIIRYLTERVVDGKRRARYDVLIVHICRDAYDAPRPLVDVNEIHHWVCPHDVPVDRILAGEHRLSHALANDDNRLAAATVIVVEVASSNNRHAECREE